MNFLRKKVAGVRGKYGRTYLDGIFVDQAEEFLEDDLLYRLVGDGDHVTHKPDKHLHQNKINTYIICIYIP